MRWYGRDDFEYDGPWWISGWATDGEGDIPIFVAAVRAADEGSARRVIEDSYDRPRGVIEWSFSNERPDDWEPFCDRFPRGDWMKWPGTRAATTDGKARK